MNKKVALFSFVSSENYGANLQALAFQWKLSNLGVNSVYVNYQMKNKLPLKRKLLNIAYHIVRLFFGYLKRAKKTVEFRNKYLNLTDVINTYDGVLKAAKQFDTLIVGSDQVWNPRYGEENRNVFLLRFDGIKPKYSYASSFGVNSINECDKKLYYDALKKFSHLTTREKTGQEIIKNIGLNAEVVLDPTLLLTKKEWQLFFNPKPIINHKYILCYVMNGDNISINYMRKYALQVNKKLGGEYKVYFIGDKEYKKLKINYSLITDAGPSEFLNLMYHASYVITNSFHGTCFSLSFEKNFNVILRKSNLFNSRIIDILTEINALDRIVYTEESWDINCLTIDVREETAQKLTQLRNNSVTLLNKIALDVNA